MSQSVFITGVSSGIGLGLANHYLDRGDTVFGISRRRPDDLITRPEFRFVSADLTDEMSAAEAIAELLKSVTQIDCAILNAGILGQICDLKDASLDQLKQVMNVNVWANKTVVDALNDNCNAIKKIITISSGAAVNGSRGWGGYSLSKAALNMLTMLYSRENTNTFYAAVAPGLIDTAMQDDLCGNKPDDRFASLEVLRSKRGTSDMPTPDVAAAKLVTLFDSIENHVQSGGFVDIRQIAEFQ